MATRLVKWTLRQVLTLTRAQQPILERSSSVWICGQFRRIFLEYVASKRGIELEQSPFELVEKLEVPFFERRSAYREHHLEGFKSILIALFTLVMSKNCLFCPCFREEKTEYVEIHWGFFSIARS